MARQVEAAARHEQHALVLEQPQAERLVVLGDVQLDARRGHPLRRHPRHARLVVDPRLRDGQVAHHQGAVAGEHGIAVLQHVHGQRVVHHAAADHGVVAVRPQHLGDLRARRRPADARAGHRVRLRQAVRGHAALVDIRDGGEVLRAHERQVHLVHEHEGAHAARDVGHLLHERAVEERARRVVRVVQADEPRVGAHEALELAEVGVPAAVLVNAPEVHLGAERPRYVVELLVAGVLGDHVVAARHEREHGQQVRARRAVGLQHGCRAPRARRARPPPA